MSNTINIGKTLEHIRQTRNMTQNEFAVLVCGISASSYSNIINEKKSVNLNTLASICARLEIPIEVFIFKSVHESSIDDNERLRSIKDIEFLLEKAKNILYPPKKDFLSLTDLKEDTFVIKGRGRV